ncbi:MAG: FtsX-like permease family protein [Acidimicrobiales bacterium]
MLRLTLRNISRRKLRFALTTLAVVLGVSFLSTSFFLTDKLRDTFAELATDITGELDLVVRTSISEDGQRLNRLPVPAEVLAVVVDIPGVAAAAPSIAGWNVVPILLDDDGEPVAVPHSGAPQLGVNYNGIDGLEQMFVTSGRTPERTGSLHDPDTVGEFILDNRTADDHGFTIGETYTVSAPGGNRRFLLVGTANFGSPDENKTVGTNISSFDTATVQELLGKEGLYDEIAIILEPGAEPAEVMAAIQSALDVASAQFHSFLDAIPAEQRDAAAAFAEAELEVVTAETKIAEDQGDFDQFISIISSVLLGFAIIAVVVSTFIINNTFAIVIGQRVRELALLRALGATGRQISRSVRLEAAVIGIVATALGLVGGYLLASLLRWVLVATGFGELPGAIPIRPRTIILAAVVGIGSTVLSAIGPSRRVRRIPPVAAMRDDVRITPTGLRRRLQVGSAVTAVGIAALTMGMTVEMSTVSILTAVGAGAFTTFMGVYLLSPVIARPVASLLGWPIQRLYRIPGRLATDNARRSPRRTAATAAALTIGLALVSLAAVVSDSMKATFVRTIEESIEADLFVYTGAFNPAAGFSTELGEDLTALSVDRPDLVETVMTYRFAMGGMSIDGSYKDVSGADLDVLADHMNIMVTEGHPDGEGRDGLLLHVDPATDMAVTVGDQVTVGFPGGRSTDLTVAAVFEDSTILGNWVVDVDVFDRFLPTAPDAFVSVVFPDGASATDSRSAVEVVTDEYPQVRVEDRTEFKEAQEAQLDQLLSIIQVFLGLSLFIAVLGITNTLALSVYERTRELGLLRAIGMTRRQLRRMVRWEAVIIALFGGLLGVGMGVLFGLAVIAAIPETFVDIVSIPYSSLLGYLVVSGLFGMLAAILPARRAARLNVLDAISYE